MVYSGSERKFVYHTMHQIRYIHEGICARSRLSKKERGGSCCAKYWKHGDNGRRNVAREGRFLDVSRRFDASNAFVWPACWPFRRVCTSPNARRLAAWPQRAIESHREPQRATLQPRRSRLLPSVLLVSLSFASPSLCPMFASLSLSLSVCECRAFSRESTLSPREREKRGEKRDE